VTRAALRGPLRKVTRLVPASVALASVLLFLVSLMWAVITPGFRTPDEWAHLNSVIRVAEGGGWPQPGNAYIEDEVLDAYGLAGAKALYPRSPLLPPAPPAQPVWPPAPAGTLFTDVEPTPIAARGSFDTLDDGVLTAQRDQMTLHPPGYYYAAAAVYNVLDAGDWRFDRAMFLLRAFTALSIALTVPVCCYVATRELTGRESLGKIAAFVPLFLPQLHFISGAIQNDGFSIASAAVVWAVAIAIMSSGPTRSRLVILTLAHAAACLSKATALSLLPIVPVVLAIAYRRSVGGSLRAWGRPWLMATAGTLTGTFLLGGWWWAVNLLRYGTLQPGGDGLTQRPGPVSSPIEFLIVFVRRLRWTFFGEVGVKQPESFATLTLLLAVVFVGLFMVGLFGRRQRAERLVMALGIGVTTALLFNQSYSGHLATKLYPAIQGRYLFVLLVPIAVFLTLGLARLAGLARVRAERLLPVVAAAALGVAVLGTWLAFRQYYTAPGGSWGDALDRFVGWAPWPPVVLAALAASLPLTGFALCWHLGQAAGDAAAEPTPPPSAAAPAVTEGTHRPTPAPV
jgi:hypothetical protein